MKSTQEKIAEILLSINAVSLNLSKPFKYSSGILSPIYTDCRLLISDPVSRKKVISVLVKEIVKHDTQVKVIAGTATAGIPHAAWVSEKMKLPMVYVRGKAKDHGKGNQIEGRMGKKQHIVVIEDLISTGGSSIESVKALRESGAIVNSVYSIMTYDMEVAKKNFQEAKIKSISLTNFQSIVSVAQKKKLIKKSEMENILLWSQDPKNWAKKIGLI
jgi:orotate phosphoribosyltransferase